MLDKYSYDFSTFYSSLLHKHNISVPKLYYHGLRKLNVILTQLRCTASFLNHDLYKFIFYLAQRVAAVPPKKMRTTSFLFVPNILK